MRSERILRKTRKIKNPTSGNTGQKWGTLLIIF